MPEAWSHTTHGWTCRCICLCRSMGTQSLRHKNGNFPQLFVWGQFREWLIVGSWVFYAKSFAIQQGYICRCMCLRRHVFMQSLWHTQPELPRNHPGRKNVGSWVFYAKSSAIQYGCICRCICLGFLCHTPPPPTSDPLESSLQHPSETPKREVEFFSATGLHHHQVLPFSMWKVDFVRRKPHTRDPLDDNLEHPWNNNTVES